MSQTPPGRPAPPGHGVAISMSFVFETSPEQGGDGTSAQGIQVGGTRRSNVSANWLTKMPASWSKAVTDDMTTMRSASTTRSARPLSDAYLASMNRSKRSRIFDSRPIDRTDGPKYSKSRYSKAIEALKDLHDDSAPPRQPRGPNTRIAGFEKIAEEIANSPAAEACYKEKLAEVIIKRAEKDADYTPQRFQLVEKLKNAEIKL